MPAVKQAVLTLLLFTVLLLSVSAARAEAQSVLDKTISLSVNRLAVRDVIALVQKQAKVRFLYSPSAINLTQTISFKGENVKLKDFFDEVFLPIDIEYEVVDGKILLSPGPQKTAPALHSETNLTAPGRTITGTVTDSSGQPLAGASVKVKGSEGGTRTNNSGAFTLELPEGATELEISYIGFTTQTIMVRGSTMTIVLNSAVTLGEEVVVTALGISKSSRKLGYASTKVGGDLLSVAKESNVANSLEGRVPGLNISGVNSGPGGSARILIRGISNFTSATGPLIVIDGVPMDNTQRGAPGVYGGQDAGDGISSINPDDIENVVVLKGSTASALYGVRAANGVIQITTKSGKGAKGFGVEVNSNFSANKIVNNTDYQKVYGGGDKGLRPQTTSDLVNDAVNSWGEKLDGRPTIAMDGQLHPYSAVNDPKDKFYRIAPVATNTVSFTNATDRGDMRFSFSYLDNPSVIPNSGLKRYTANLNVNQNIMDHMKLMLMGDYVDESIHLRPSLNDMTENPNWTIGLLPSNIDPRYLKPGFNPVNGYEMALSSDGYTPNPWFATTKVINNSARKRFISSAALRYDVMKGLYVQVRSGLDLINDDLLNIEPTGIGYKRQGALQEQSKATTTELNLDALAGYSTTVLSDFSLDASAGASIRKYHYEKVGFSGSQWKQPFLYTASNLVTTVPIYVPSQEQTNSEYYTVDFGYHNFVFIGTTGRHDVFSTLPPGTGIFTPSLTSSLIFSDLVHIPKLNYGKLRASYAETSGEALPYQSSNTYPIAPTTINGQPYASIPDQVVSNKLRPYRLKEFEAGVELKGFNNRLGLDLAYFTRKTEKELISKQISIATSADFSYEPLGSTQNHGIEATLNGTILRSHDFTWTSSLNFTQVSNKLISIDGSVNPPPISTGQYRPSVGPFNNGAYIAAVQGKAISQIMAYDYKYDSKGNIVVGIDGIPQRGNLRAMGSGLPKYYGGFSNDLSYKKWTLSLLVDYKFGNKVLSGTDFFSTYYGLNKRTLPGRDNGVIVKGVGADGSANNVLVTAENFYKGLVTNVSTMSVYDGGFIKFRQATLSYLFSSSLLNRTPFQAVSISLLARNILTLLKHTDNFDPEDSFSPLPGYAGLEGNSLPQTRTFGINLNFKFKK